MNVTVQIDKRSMAKVQNTFNNMINGVTSAEKPLRESADIVVSESVKNFDNQGYTYGESWTPLKASTRKDRTRRGYNAARPILVRSGKLKKGAKVKSVSRNQAIIENEVPYAQYHQEGTRYMPKRTILTVTDKIKNAIATVFVNYIGGLIRK